MVSIKSINVTLLTLLTDVVGILIAIRIGQVRRIEISDNLAGDQFVALSPLVVVMIVASWLIVAFLHSLYDPERSISFEQETRRFLIVWILFNLVIAGSLYYSFRSVPRSFLFTMNLLSLTIGLGWRFLMYVYYQIATDHKMLQGRRTIIAGDGDLGYQITSSLTQQNLNDLSLLGVVSIDNNEEINGLPNLGPISDLKRIIQEQNVEEVILAIGDHNLLNQIVFDLQSLPVQIGVVPNYLNLALYRATAQNLAGMPIIKLRDPALSHYQRLIKRAFDLVAGSILLIIALPVMVLVALAIKYDSPGPVTFRQKRVGENGRIFTMYKFRSMYEGMENRSINNMKDRPLGDIRHKSKDDPRITPVGHFIRRTSLDELPQFINVIKGDMSLVGPRPELPWLVEKYEPWQRKRFAVSPGITGWWQVNGRSDKPMHLNTEDDLYYIQNYSLLLDISIMWKTLAAVLTKKGAY